MRNKILLAVILSVTFITCAQAQTDTTVRIFRSGMAIYAEFGLLPNNKNIREQLSQTEHQAIHIIYGINSAGEKNGIGALVFGRQVHYHEQHQLYQEQG
jgi:hypothetical protein